MWKEKLERESKEKAKENVKKWFRKSREKFERMSKSRVRNRANMKREWSESGERNKERSDKVRKM